MKKIISVVLAVIICCSTIIIVDASVIKDPNAVSGYNYTDSAKLASLLNAVFAGDIDVYSDKACTSEVNMPMGKAMSMSTTYYVKSKTTGNVASGKQCYIYANAVYNKLFNEWVGHGGSFAHSKNVIPAGTKSVSYEQFKSAGVRCGAYVRTTANADGAFDGNKGHSFIILDYDATNITFLEGNGDGNGMVRINIKSWNSFNNDLLTKKSRCISHVVQPTESYYNSLYGSSSTSTVLAQSITCTLTDPTEGQKIVKGKHPVEGTVTSKNYPLQEVKAYLDGDCIATVTLGSAYSLDIRSSAINTNLAFGSLSLGNHTLVIKARDTKHSDLVTVMTRNFVITDSSGNTGTDTSCSCVTAFAGYYLCTTTGTNLYIRSGHGSSYSTVGNVTKGAVAYIDKASGTGSSDWGHVTFNGVSGYCSMQYMKKLSTYTVSYNANGGSGAPGSQTKIQDVALTLSTTKPTRSGYTFLGWSTSSSATSASYSAGGSYTGNGNVTLYAVWKSNACSHSYSSSVTKAATCSTAGTRTYTCTKCGNSYTESIAPTGVHSYGSWTTTKAATCTATGTQQRKCNTCSKTESKTLSATGHDYKGVTSIATCTKAEETTYTCRNCGNSYKEQTGTQTAPHKWDSGVVTTSPTCAREGVKIYTCTVCKQTKKETNPKLQTHTYTEWQLTSDTEHKRICDNCGDVQVEDHVFYDEWVISEKGHSRQCWICNDEISYNHTPGSKATETEPQVCTTCGYVIKPALGHTHQWEEKLSHDEWTHWYACTGCSEKKDEGNCSYQNTCDATCEVCGGTRPVIHLPTQGWESDNENHWYICDCGETNQFGAHIWLDGECVTCEMKQPDVSAPSGNEEHTDDTPKPEKEKQPTFFEKIIDRIISWFDQMKETDYIQSLVDAAKQQKLKNEILADVREGVLPDGEYRMMFYEDKLYSIDGVEYAYVDLLESVSFEDPYVKSLKTGSLIDLSKYGLESIEVANTRITADAQSEMILQLDEWGEFYLDRPYGQKAWMLRTFNDKQVQYVLDHIAIELVDDVQIADECYRMLNENGNARYPNTIAELFALYVGQTGGDLEIMITMQAGKAVNATFYYAPVI